MADGSGMTGVQRTGRAEAIAQALARQRDACLNQAAMLDADLVMEREKTAALEEQVGSLTKRVSDLEASIASARPDDARV